MEEFYVIHIMDDKSPLKLGPYKNESERYLLPTCLRRGCYITPKPEPAQSPV